MAGKGQVFRIVIPCPGVELLCVLTHIIFRALACVCDEVLETKLGQVLDGTRLPQSLGGLPGFRAYLIVDFDDG